MTPCIHTSLEKIHILNRDAFVLLCGALIKDFAVVKPTVITPQVIKQHVATLPSLLCTLLAGPPPPTAAPPCWWRRRWSGLGTEVDSSHHGSIYSGPDALPVPTGETRACLVTTD